MAEVLRISVELLGVMLPNAEPLRDSVCQPGLFTLSLLGTWVPLTPPAGHG